MGFHTTRADEERTMRSNDGSSLSINANIKQALVEKGGVNPPQSQIPHRPPPPPPMAPQVPQPTVPANPEGQGHQSDS
jgi:hypothetical protein